MSTKKSVCTSCQELKPVSEFYKRKSKKGHASLCKACCRKKAQSRKPYKAEYWAEYSLSAKAKCRQLKRSAERRGIEFDLTPADIPSVPDTCPLSDRPLSREPGSSDRPVMDRIDSCKGYVKGNIQWTHRRANELKSNATLEELQTIVRNWEKLVS